MSKSNAYPYIRANGRQLGSLHEYVDQEIARATRDNAPADAWSYDTDGKRWRTLSDLDDRASAGNVQAADTARRLRAAV